MQTGRLAGCLHTWQLDRLVLTEDLEPAMQTCTVGWLPINGMDGTMAYSLQALDSTIVPMHTTIVLHTISGGQSECLQVGTAGS